jgi:hypothetical protein
MTDLVLMLLIVAFFALSAGLVGLCNRLVARDGRENGR